MVKIAENSGFLQLLSSYSNKNCSIRETGMSLTCPCNPESSKVITTNTNQIGNNNNSNSKAIENYSTKVANTANKNAKITNIGSNGDDKVRTVASSYSEYQNHDSSDDITSQSGGGDGMEWHSDGSQGE